MPNIEFRRNDNLLTIGNARVTLIEGIGADLLVPRTNTRLLDNQRYDEFHLAGYGFSALVGVHVTIYKSFFIQSEFKGGYINMPDIRTTLSERDKASQHFFFSQWNILFGIRHQSKQNKRAADKFHSHIDDNSNITSFRY